MKFIISESKFKSSVFHYLDFALDSIEFLGDYYFIEKGTDNVLIKTGDGYVKNSLKIKISSHIVHEVKTLFTISTEQSYKYVIDWVEEKTKKTVLSRDITPYKQELPPLLKRKS